MRSRIPLITFAGVLLACASLQAQESHQHLQGTIKAVKGARLELQPAGGAPVWVDLDRNTRYREGEARASRGRRRGVTNRARKRRRRARSDAGGISDAGGRRRARSASP